MNENCTRRSEKQTCVNNADKSCKNNKKKKKIGNIKKIPISHTQILIAMNQNQCREKNKTTKGKSIKSVKILGNEEKQQTQTMQSTCTLKVIDTSYVQSSSEFFLFFSCCYCHSHYSVNAWRMLEFLWRCQCK